MNAAAAPRYLFDLDFDAENRAKEEEEAEPTISLYEHEAQMAALERRVRSEAHDAGRQEAIEEGSNAFAEETERLTGVVQTLLTRLDTEIGIREERAVRIAISAAKKLARRLLKDEPIGEVEHLFRSCLAPMFDASHLVVRMNAEHVDAVRERLEAIATAQGFEGRLIFMGEDDFAPSDTRIEWADGGLARSQNDIEKGIDDLIAGYLSARGGTSLPSHTDDPQVENPQDVNSPAMTSQDLRASMEGALDE
jgi:flagellar assembly protein FliH